MANAKRLVRFVGGCATAGVVAFSAASIQPARAAGGRKPLKAGGALQIQTINVAQEAGVQANRVIEIVFSQAIDPATVTPATIQIRGENATATGYTKQVFGSMQVVGNVVRFYPRLPTHLRDATGSFFPVGSPLDDAAANAGFKASTGYEVRVIGRPSVSPVKALAGKPLKITTFARFKTAAASPPERLWTTQSYADSPPPQFSFSNPPDTVPTAASQYATHGGTQDVPNSILLSLFCTKVPLAPGTARNQGNVEMTMLARKGDYGLRRPVAGNVFVEQNFDTTLLAFQPRVSLADLGTYSLRVGKGVKDLTEQNDFAVSRSRDQLRHIYDFLSSARALSPGVPVTQLPDPPAELITDWPALGAGNPGAPAARGVLKANILALGDTYPDEIDPRTMLIFTSRDELTTQDKITIEFTKGENLFDANLSTGEFDTTVPSAASATFTAAGGSAALGDYTPTVSTTLSADAFTNAELNYRNIVIPQNVIVTLTGLKPPTIKALSITINGEIRANGVKGTDGDINANYTLAISSTNAIAGTKGILGGGSSGGSPNTLSSGQKSGSGTPGNDLFGVTASAQDGGRGGLGGAVATGTYYSESGGGGGGGGTRTAGTAGASGAYNPSWNGAGGAGGAAALGNDDLSPLVGGGGGGGGGTGGMLYNSYNWGSAGGGGGTGGGAMILQTSGLITVGNLGAVRAHGGQGGTGTNFKNWSAGPGGGGGGGSILLRSTKGYSISNPSAQLDVGGGSGGINTGSYVAPYGGNGGAGLVRTEDPKGGIAIPGATQGTFFPVGAGVPSFIFTKWLDLGVQDPRILPYATADILTVPQNDAIYVQAQMTKEHPTLFGTPDLTAINSQQNSTNTAIMSQWQPIKVHDETGVIGGAFTPTLGAIPGLPLSPPKEYSAFSVAGLNGKGYRFIRFRIYFQLDATQNATSLLPYVDRLTTNFQFNF